jgi:hypothetical protein
VTFLPHHTEQPKGSRSVAGSIAHPRVTEGHRKVHMHSLARSGLGRGSADRVSARAKLESRRDPRVLASRLRLAHHPGHHISCSGRGSRADREGGSRMSYRRYRSLCARAGQLIRQPAWRLSAALALVARRRRVPPPGGVSPGRPMGPESRRRVPSWAGNRSYKNKKQSG